MKPYIIGFLLGWSQLIFGDNKEFCTQVGPVYESKILKQIQTGIAFDMIILIHQNQKTVCKKVLNYSFDLWKEKITLQINGRSAGTFAINQGLQMSCEQMLCKEKPIDRGSPRTLQVLLNPIWEGEGKLSFRTRTETGIRFYRLDWNTILQDLPKEVEIINWELLL